MYLSAIGVLWMLRRDAVGAPSDDSPRRRGARVAMVAFVLFSAPMRISDVGYPCD